jgi:hypothetical protein
MRRRTGETSRARLACMASREASSAEDPCHQGCGGRACRILIGPSHSSPGTKSCLEHHSQQFYLHTHLPTPLTEIASICITMLSAMLQLARWCLPFNLSANYHATTHAVLVKGTRTIDILSLASLTCIYLCRWMSVREAVS